MKCKMKFSMAIYRWICETHGEQGDEHGCLTGARERISELEEAQKSTKHKECTYSGCTNISVFNGFCAEHKGRFYATKEDA